MKGRKPKPVEQKRRNGNPGKRPLPEIVLIAGRQAPPMPEYLSEGAQQAWDEIVPALDAAGLLDGIDGATLEALCTSIAQMRRLSRELRTAPLMVAGYRGDEKPNPLFALHQKASAEVRKWSEAFGLDPAARARLGLNVQRGLSLEQELDQQLGRTPLRRVK